MMNHRVPDFSDKEIINDLPIEAFTGKEYTDAKIRRSRIKTVIEECVFINSDFLGANFTDSEFINCKFIETDFRGSYLVDCDITNCEFIGCRLQDVDAQGAIITSTTFDNCRLQDFELQYGEVDGVLFTESCFVNCDFLGVKFKDSTTQKCDIKECITRYSKGWDELCSSN